MNFLADEGVERQVVDELREAGHDVAYVVEMGPGISDTVVFKLANDKSAILLTVDTDFGELVFRQRRLSSGVVLIRLAGLTTQTKVQIVVSAIEKRRAELSQAFSVIGPNSIRIRRLSGE